MEKITFPKDDDIAVLAERAGEAARVLKLLANERRLVLLCRLAAAGEMTVGALAISVGLSQSALSQHLSRMREEGLVTFRREGQTLHYPIDASALHTGNQPSMAAYLAVAVIRPAGQASG